MGNYSYKIITKEGKEKKGAVEAQDKNTAYLQLRSEGNTVLSLEEGSSLNKEISFGGRKKKVKSKDLSVFCRQFNSLLKAGVSIIMSLDMLGDQTENKTLKQAIYNVRDGVQKGETLANSMKKESCFPDLLISMMEAGEQSGNVETSLIRMSEHFEKDTKVKAMLKKAMMYPIILGIVAIAVLVVMVVVVIPSFSKMFADMDTGLPGITVALLAMSDFIRGYWYIIIAVIVALTIGIKTFKKTKTGIYFFANLGVKMPAFGNLTIKTASARFARTFSTMLSSGMPMIEAMEITAKTMDNQLFKDALNDCALQIQRGVPLTAPLKKSGLFPPLILHMVGIGEESGNLEEMLNNCATYFDEEVESATQQVMALMEPMIIIVLAGIVCLILAAIYGPMITMYNAMGNM